MSDPADMERDPVACHLALIIESLTNVAVEAAAIGGTPASLMALGLAAGAVQAARERWLARPAAASAPTKDEDVH